MPVSCLNTVRSIVDVRSPSIQSDPSNTDLKDELSSDPGVQNSSDSEGVLKTVDGRKVMIVVESSIHAKNALHWALTRTLQSQDLFFLLYVTRPSKQGLIQGDKFTKKSQPTPKIPDFLHSMKIMCEVERPEVRTEIIVAEGKEKGPTVVEEAKKREVDMLILGMKKRSISWQLLMLWAGRQGVVEYCIQNASCVATAVTKNENGGYWITNKHQKNYWLLA